MEVLNVDEYAELSLFDKSIQLETHLMDEALHKALERKASASISAEAKQFRSRDALKFEFETFTCIICFEEFKFQLDYDDHMNMHKQKAHSDVVSEGSGPHTTASSNCNTSHAVEKMLTLDDGPQSAADFAQTVVTPLPARIVKNNENEVKKATEAGSIRKSKSVVTIKNAVLENQLCYRDNDRNTIINVLKNTNKSMQQDNSPKNSATSVYKIISVSKDFNVQSTQIKFPASNNVKKMFACQLCGDMFEKKESLVKHRQTHDGVPKKPLICKFCSFTCKFKSGLAIHMRSHNGEKLHFCMLCEYSGLTSTHLESHMRTHGDEKPYSCEVCNFKCKQRSSLLRHMRLHTGEKPYSCKLCDFKCSEGSNLVNHMRTHTGVKPFSCNICEFKFARKCHLVRHMITHTGEKPYYCDVCHSKFSRNCHLMRHIRTHTGDKPYSCEMCSAKFAEKSRLKSHIKTHTVGKRYSCKLCTFKCKNKKNLVKHRRSHTVRS